MTWKLLAREHRKEVLLVVIIHDIKLMLIWSRDAPRNELQVELGNQPPRSLTKTVSGTILPLNQWFLWSLELLYSTTIKDRCQSLVVKSQKMINKCKSYLIGSIKTGIFTYICQTNQPNSCTLQGSKKSMHIPYLRKFGKSSAQKCRLCDRFFQEGEI